MSIVIDCTQSPSSAAMRAAGVTGVCRYVAPFGLSKVIRKPEYDRLKADGFTVILNSENQTLDWLTGASGGMQRALEAAGQAIRLGYPLGLPIPSSADFDMTRTQWTRAGADFGKAYRDTLRANGYRPGVYGSVDVLRWCRDELGYDWLWQSMSTAFSAGHNAIRLPGIQLWQRRHMTISGVDCDVNDIVDPNYGGNMAAPKPYAADNASASSWALTQRLETYNVHSGDTADVLTNVYNPAAIWMAKVEQFIDGFSGTVGGLSVDDRALIQGLTDAVNALNSRLASP